MTKEQKQNEESHSRENNIQWKSTWGILGGLFLVAFVVGLGAFALVDQNVIGQESQIEKLVQSPRRYYGDEISLVGNVSSVLGSRAMTIEGPGILSDEVLVISKNPLVPIGGGFDEALYQAGTRVSIRGEARKLDIDRVEEELGVDLVDSTFEEWIGKPVVIADTIREDL